MATHIAFHEVDDVDHWLSSSKREEVFSPLGITMRAFRDPAGSNRVGLIAEIPDMAAFEEFMQTDAAADATARIQSQQRVRIAFDTVCIHADMESAVARLRAIRQRLGGNR